VDEGFLRVSLDGETDTTNEGDIVVERLCKAAAAIAERVTTKKPEPIAPKVSFTFSDELRRYTMAHVTARPTPPEDFYSEAMTGVRQRQRERLEHHRREQRKQEERERQQRRWDRRYDHFKRLGTQLHERNRVTRTEWKQLFDIVFARTDSLKNAPFAFEIYKAIRNILRTPYGGGFRELRRAIFDAQDPRT
jgi:hypothetical protein